MDLKRTADCSAVGRLEIAKDIAAFANAVGGTILYGATEDQSTGTLARYVGLSEAEAAEIARAVQQAAVHLVAPSPIVDVDRVQAPDTDNRFLIVVDISPFPGQAVGVRVNGNRDLHGSGEPMFRFPVRTTTHTVYYDPTQLPILMDVQYRRKVQQLEAIPVDRRGNVSLVSTVGRPLPVAILAIDQSANFVEIRNLRRSMRGGQSVGWDVLRLPLDAVTRAYAKSDTVWEIIIDMAIEGNGLKYPTR